MLYEDQSDMAIPGRQHFAPILATTLNLTTTEAQLVSYVPPYAALYCFNRHVFSLYEGRLNYSITIENPYGLLNAIEFPHLPVN